MSKASGASDFDSLLTLQGPDILDRIRVVLSQEQTNYQCGDYLERRHCSQREPQDGSESSGSCVSTSSRRKVVRWLYDVVDYFALQRETVALAMNYVDRFMCTSSPVVPEARENATTYQLVAVSCLFIATKVFDLLRVDADVLVRASRGCYTVDQITSMETTILMALRWRISAPTALGFAHHAIAFLAKVLGADTLVPSVLDFSRLQIELAVAEYDTAVLRPPSIVAVASILNSMELLDFSEDEKQLFYDALARYAGIDALSEDVDETRFELNDIFDRQSGDVLNRAPESSYKALQSQCDNLSTATPPTKSISFTCAKSPTSVNDYPQTIDCHRH